jgi:glucokinase
MKYYIGIDIGATDIKAGLLNSNLKIIKRKKLDTREFPNRDSMIEAVIDLISSVRLGLKGKIKGIGIGAPGLINPEKGWIYSLVNIAGWKDVPLKRILERRLKTPIFIDNDVNVMALAELYYGRAKAKKNVVCLTLGTGVGGGIILEGKLYRGSTFSAGEIGHIPLNEDGPGCNCGGRACLERYVGNRYIVEGVLEKIRKAPLPTIIPDLVKDDLAKVNPEIISIAANKGDLLARDTWQDVGRRLGINLAGIVNLLNPEMIIVGGGLAKAGEVLFNTIRKTIKERAMSVPAGIVKVVPAKLKEDAGIIGAAVLVREGLKTKVMR